jgi:tripartite ATP-independent transporter DctM subunit
MFATFAVTIGIVIGIALLLGGLPIAIAISIGSLVMLILQEGLGSLKAMGFIAWGSMNSSALSALPLFVLMADLLLRSGVSDTFYDGTAKIIRKIPGGLLQTNIAGSALFAAICGSSVATAAAIGSVAIPKQKQEGYDIAMTCGSLAAGGTLGILIPPSLAMIIYATFTELSVAKLFMAGVVPGIVLTIIFMIYIAIRSLLQPHLVPKIPPNPKGAMLEGMMQIGPMVVMMLLVLGSIYMGFATATEAAAVGALGAALIAAVVRRPPLRIYAESVMNAIIVSAGILLIAFSAFLFAYAVDSTGTTEALTRWVVGLNLDVKWFMFFLLVFYAILGCLVDSIGMIVLTVPLVLPILAEYKIDLIWFGVILVVVVELGQITPPVGINLFVVDSIAKVGIGPVIRGVVPYFYLIGFFLALLCLFPQMATWLPSHL